MSGMFRMFWFAMAALLLTAAAYAQQAEVRLAVTSQNIGLGAVVRPGDWTPMLIELENPASQPRQVRCVWVTADADGDQVLWTRQITLTPQRKQKAWLYAMVPGDVSDKTAWRVDVVDVLTNQLLATQALTMNQPFPRNEGLIGVTSTLGLGLDPYAQAITQHEAVRFIRGLDPASLPDRWHGLSSLSALIWTPDAADPASPAISPQTHQAIRQWVRRGGHLVIVMPTVGEVWSRSLLSDLLPAGRMVKTPGTEPPSWLGIFRQTRPPIDTTAFEPGADTAVLLRADAVPASQQALPLAVARQYGFGRVTVIGVDLTDRRLVANGVPNGADLWNAVFGWRSPAHDRARLQRELDDRNFSELNFRPEPIELASFVPEMIAMRQTAATALLAAIVLFAIYWVVAGPIPLAVLRRRRQSEHSWMVFLTVVLFFSVVAWAAALALRPHETRISHVSVLDYDGSGQAMVRSWLSLFVPRHGEVELNLQTERPEESDDTLATTGLLASQTADQAQYLDTQRYEVAGARPTGAAMPFRATARQLDLNLLLAADELDRLLPQDYVPPQVTFEPRGAMFAARLSHNLPGSLRDVIVIYAEGNGVVRAWRHPQTSWAPGQVLQIEPPAHGQFASLRLGDSAQAHRDAVSYLGLLRKLKPGNDILKDQHAQVVLSSDRRIPLVEMLSFYSALPPPDYEFESRNEAVAYHRSLGRALDMTHLLHLRRLILIGFMEDVPLPAPLTVNDRSVPSQGWTIVRWIHPLPPAPRLEPEPTSEPGAHDAAPLLTNPVGNSPP